MRKTSFKTQENTSLCYLKRYIIIYPHCQNNELSCMSLSAEKLDNLIMAVCTRHVVVGHYDWVEFEMVSKYIVLGFISFP